MGAGTGWTRVYLGPGHNPGRGYALRGCTSGSGWVWVAAVPMEVTKPYEFVRFGAMEVTKPCEYLGFGAMEVTKPYEFTGFGAMEAKEGGNTPRKEV